LTSPIGKQAVDVPPEEPALTDVFKEPDTSNLDVARSVPSPEDLTSPVDEQAVDVPPEESKRWRMKGIDLSPC
jgi:hypothetical protein